jgi:hypothetical protein
LAIMDFLSNPSFTFSAFKPVLIKAASHTLKKNCSIAVRAIF